MDNLKPCPFCGGEDVKVIAALDEELSVDCWLEDLPSYGGKSSNYGVVCLKCQGNSGYRRTPQEAVDNWNRRPNMWIPVTERLPEEGDTVLMWHKEGFVMLAVNMFDEMDDVIYWMPLPEPPKEVAQ